MALFQTVLCDEDNGLLPALKRRPKFKRRYATRADTHLPPSQTVRNLLLTNHLAAC